MLDVFGGSGFLTTVFAWQSVRHEIVCWERWTLQCFQVEKDCCLIGFDPVVRGRCSPVVIHTVASRSHLLAVGSGIACECIRDGRACTSKVRH